MAPIFLDARTSQNASTANSINVPTTNAYVLWGQVGLTVTAANPSIPMRVQFDGTITLRLSSSASNFTNLVEVKIVRGTDPNAAAVFSGIKTLTFNGSELGPQEYTFGASDYNPPKGSGLLVYSAFVKNITGSSESDVRRVGPESFNACAFGN
ncbi:hypothetical protein [Priestia megaterium]|uniref:hypothetical protein n=1 Tax=Priestia megaterium TaxID=1404 RepID=UPI001F14272E|nr:hypothetical protein [Priestia megaterium]UMZ35916.1 hypothetical protein MGJ28_27685 [Priestia megaterium]